MINLKKILLRCATLGAILSAAGSAQGVVAIYITKATFDAAVTAPGVDTFDGFNITGTTASPLARTAGAYGYTASAPGLFFGAGTAGDPWLSTNTATDTITFNNFTGGVKAFGGNFFASDAAGAFMVGSMTLIATDGSGSTFQTFSSIASPGFFMGFVSDGLISSVTLTAVQSGNVWPTADNLTLASAPLIPEASHYTLMAGVLGLIVMGLRCRR